MRGVRRAKSERVGTECGRGRGSFLERINPLTGEKEIPDKIWEIQHTHKNVNGERGQLHQLVVEQQSEEIDNPMTSDEILSLVLGVILGYVRGKGHRKKPPKKSQMQQANIEASVSLAEESMHQEMQLDIERKLQEEREQMEADLKRDMDQDLQKKLEEEREHMKGEVEKIFQEKMVALMAGMQ
ncbi:putative formin-like protein 3-like [Capsicum annuum]|nr:putative formin-like protein 3-like [Capsicum annuum]KAF3677297.1 putative formin-like protein 3-like [Capsicum annuum]